MCKSPEVREFNQVSRNFNETKTSTKFATPTKKANDSNVEAGPGFHDSSATNIKRFPPIRWYDTTPVASPGRATPVAGLNLASIV